MRPHAAQLEALGCDEAQVLVFPADYDCGVTECVEAARDGVMCVVVSDPYQTAW
jgi:hypothetical protein